ncbi:hypothetical protein TWF481_001282 [Arthrobotrys musiformis]|uniref:Uncharacterized protein n=1 Tax=Arthrobotrys musiformis TaxID=47236 RepID=A0AAV9WS78_9PEZI
MGQAQSEFCYTPKKLAPGDTSIFICYVCGARKEQGPGTFVFNFDRNDPDGLVKELKRCNMAGIAEDGFTFGGLREEDKAGVTTPLKGILYLVDEDEIISSEVISGDREVQFRGVYMAVYPERFRGHAHYIVGDEVLLRQNITRPEKTIGWNSSIDPSRGSEPHSDSPKGLRFRKTKTSPQIS